MRTFLVLFILVPLIEIYVLIRVGKVIGGLPTVGLIVLTAIVGLMLLRQQGYAALTRAQSRLSLGEIPAKEAVEGVFLAVGGALLLTPGFITDALGFACLIPGIRHVLIASMLSRFQTVTVVRSTRGGGSSPGERRGGTTVEGEYQKESEERENRIDRDR